METEGARVNGEDFKQRAMKAVNCLRDEFSAKELALELYDIYGLKSPLQTWIAHVNACFNPHKPEFFTWCDIVNLMRITGCREPLNWLCQEMGLSEPVVVNEQIALEQTMLRIRHLKRELQEQEQKLASLQSQNTVVNGARFMRGN
ncbi:MAG: hypothetical protein CMQ37_01630 [Gammaproteobacteria bacterium]|nr:hypothetical protein [Gammaproteobacteria bacterium]|tara:strand:- start:722 stop:1159 length:438 start_codon:yes stop_codon:yes gene_type:complete